MRRGPRLPVLAAACWVLAAVAPGPAPAQVDSIEAMVADADVVAVATLGDVWRTGGDAGWVKGRAVIRLADVIKGDAAPGETTVVVPSSFEGSFHLWKRTGGRKLVFLVRPARAAWHPPGNVYPWALRTFGWTTRQVTAEAAPAARGGPGRGALPAPAGGAVAVTLDMRVIDGLDDAVAAAGRSAARTVAGQTRYVHLAVPEESELRRAVPEFAYQTLRVPVDDRAEAAARKWSADPAYAEQTATVLAHFDSDDNAAILARLLDHPRRLTSGRPGKMTTWHYPVRDRAYRALERWGRTPRRVALRGPADFYRPLSARHLVIAAACVLVPAAGALPVRRRRRRRAAADAPPGPPSTVVAPGPRRFPAYAVVFAGVFALFLWLDWGGRGVVHELTASSGRSRFWVSSYRGGLQFARVIDWPVRQPFSYGRFDLRDAPPTLWNEDGVFPTSDRHFAGFRRLSGSMFGNSRGATYAYESATVPIALLAVLAALPPAWHGLAVWRDRALRRSRTARGCCAACGYDLRGREAAGRCPECGTTARPRPHR